MSRKSARNAAKNASTGTPVESSPPAEVALPHKRNRLLTAVCVFAVVSLITVAVLAERGVTGSKTASFSSAATSPNAVTAMPSPTSTPQLSKEYIYAGSRMLAVEDANAPSSSSQPADLVVWRNSNGTWYVMDSTDGTQTGSVWGVAGDIPKPADFDGDGLYDFCVYRPNSTAQTGTFYIQPNNGTTFYSVQFGLHTDLPVPADYDGDGRADVAVYRPSNATFYIINSGNAAVVSLAIGQNNSTPLPADYDGDGRVDPGVYKLNGNTYEWMLYKSTINQTLATFPYGDVPNGDVPATGDFNGDGVFDVAVRRVNSNAWIVQNVGTLSMNISGFTMQSADKPVAGDYDGDGTTDAAVWRPSTGTWFIRKSTNGQMRQDVWGASSDTPVPAPFRR